MPASSCSKQALKILKIPEKIITTIGYMSRIIDKHYLV